MKLIKNIMSIVFFTAVSTVVMAQDPMENIKPIADAISANCDAKMTKQDSVNYSLYREHFKQDNYKDAYKGWKYVFENAPKLSVKTHVDGIKMYEAFADEVEKGSPEYNAYADTILAIYEIRANCFGMTSDLMMRKAFAWYTHKNKGNEEYVYNMFNETAASFEADGEKNDISSAFLVPWILMAIKANKTAKAIEADEVLGVYEEISEIADFNMSAGNDVGKYKGASDKVFEYLEKYGYLDCENIIPMAEKKYNENPDDLATAIKVYKMLKGYKCYDAPFFIEVAQKVYTDQPSAALAEFLTQKALKDGNYTLAIQYAEDGIEMAETNDEKATLTLRVAEIHYKKGDYSTARSFAYKAAELKSGWGDPYIMIGRMYASSGSRCGSGTGWDSQVVTWAAIDMWNKAKSVDGSVATKAQNLINQYTQYMPTKSDIFQQNLQVGGSYTVPCWIGATTTIRSSN